MLAIPKTAAPARPSRARGPQGRARLSSLAPLALCCALLLAPAAALAAEAGLSDDEAARLQAALDAQAAGVFYELYRVQTGDTVENIAARFGITPDRIRALNRVSPTAQPKPGSSIAIPLPRSRPAQLSSPPNLPAQQDLQPCYAAVVVPSAILSRPAASPTARVFYEPDRGDQLIVAAEQGDYWGVIMVDGSTGWIAKSALELTDRTVSPDALDTMLKGGRPDIVQEALRHLGTPYHYGGRLPYNVDCSLFVQTVFAACGLRLPRTADAQYDYGRPVNHSELLPGDRLYFVSKSGRINHTGIYIGAGRFVHASARRGRVGIDELSDSLYWRRFAGARRS